MKAGWLKYYAPVCLVGGGALTREMLAQAQAIAPVLIAADGAADRLARWELKPDAIIGDMDSILEPKQWQRDVDFVQIDEQDSTDFGKCLYATEAPFYVAVGFTGRRIDHMLAVFSTMLQHPDKTVILIGEAEVAALIPPGAPVAMTLEVGAVVSIYPLGPVEGTISTGLKWSIEGLRLEAGQQVGTSNEVSSPEIQIGVDRAGALLMLEPQYLAELVNALTA